MRSLIAAKTMPSQEALELQCVLRARGMDDIADELLLAAAEPGIQAIKVIGVASVDPPIQASQVPVDHPYASGKSINLGAATIAAAGSAVADIVTAGYATLTAAFRIGNATTPATALGDLSAGVGGYEDDGTTGFGAQTGPFMVPDFVIRALGLSGSVAWVVNRYVLGGIDKVRSVVTNNNVAALQGGTCVYFLQK